MMLDDVQPADDIGNISDPTDAISTIPFIFLLQPAPYEHHLLRNGAVCTNFHSQFVIGEIVSSWIFIFQTSIIRGKIFTLIF